MSDNVEKAARELLRLQAELEALGLVDSCLKVSEPFVTAVRR